MTQKVIEADAVCGAIARLVNVQEPLSKITKLTVVLEAGRTVRYSVECIGTTNECEPPYTEHLNPMEMETQNAILENRWRHEKNV